ncbi:MAG: adaptor protein MecA [Eubacteriales bacterium]|nr:adaptor protein MecA [Eubacteriales bacterium]
MKITRINENTISCIISPEDLRANGIRLDDFFERKKEAVDFIRGIVAQAAISENFDLQGELTTMRVSVLPDHSLSLLITKEETEEGVAKEVRKLAQRLFESIAARAAEKAKEQEQEEAEEDPSDSLVKALLEEKTPEEGAKDGGKKKENDGACGKKQDAFMFSFYSVRDAMDCCRVFANIGQVDSSFYYLREDDVYFLIVRRLDNTPADFERLVLSANEFGELVTSHEQYISYVREHGVCIAAEHAVEMFIDVIPGIQIPRIRAGS